MEKPTLMLVDDDAILCKFYALTLSKKYNTHTFTDPLAALNLIEKGFKPDLIVSDLNMPLLNGVALIVSIRKYLSDTPILVVSGNTGVGRQKSLEAGANEFLGKPFHPSDLNYSITKLLEKQEEKPSLMKRLFARA